MTNDEIRRKHEARSLKGRAEFGFRISDFSRVSAFGLRISRQGFTLIEMLVVIAIIGILASLIFPVTAAVARARIRSSARAQLAQIETAIADYKTKLGYYPPDNPILSLGSSNFAVCQLYYELGGTINTNGPTGTYQTMNGAVQISAVPNSIHTAFNTTRFDGFMNSSKGATSDDAQSPVNFFKNIKSGQSLLVAPFSAANPVELLGANIKGPLMYTDSSGNAINPWRYNSSNPVNNPNSYDLWIDVLIGGKTNRICNWTSQPLIVAPNPIVPGSY